MLGPVLVDNKRRGENDDAMLKAVVCAHRGLEVGGGGSYFNLSGSQA